MPLREVAAAAGLTTGAIQHHFRSKNDLLLLALEHQGGRFVQRLRERANAPGAGTEPRVVLRAILAELLPLDEERRAEATVSLTFERHAADDAELRRLFRDQYRHLRGLVAAQLPGPDRDQDADLLLALIDGLRGTLLLGTSDEPHTLLLLDRAIASVLR